MRERSQISSSVPESLPSPPSLQLNEPFKVTLTWKEEKNPKLSAAKSDFFAAAAGAAAATKKRSQYPTV